MPSDVPPAPRDSPGVIRVVLADPHGMVREGIRHMLEREADLHVVAEAADGHEAIELVRRLGPDVLVLSSQPGGAEVTSVLERVTASKMAVSVVILSGNDGDELESLIELGAQGFLSKTAPSRDLIAAIRQVSTGESHLRPHETAAAAADELLRGEEPTRRELEVLRLVGEGCSNHQIAERLSIGEPTVRYHLGHIYMKLRARSRTQAVYLARQRGWLQ